MATYVQGSGGHDPPFMRSRACTWKQSAIKLARRSSHCIIHTERLQSDNHVLRLQAIHKRKRPADLARCQFGTVLRKTSHASRMSVIQLSSLSLDNVAANDEATAATIIISPKLVHCTPIDSLSNTCNIQRLIKCQ